MKKLFEEKVYDILPVENGFIVVYEKGIVEEKLVVSFKSVSTENGVVEQRTKGDYLFVKYGNPYKRLSFETGNYITTSAAVMQERTFICNRKGEAYILDYFGEIIWQGSLKYKDKGPTSIVGQNNSIWATFPDENVIIRFNLNTHREELRIGGSKESAFNKPTGLWIDPSSDTMLVCNTGDNNIIEVNLKTYSVFEYHKFDRPVYKYVKVGTNELVILDSYLYKL